MKETQLFGKHTHIYSNAFALRPRQEQCVKQTDRLEVERLILRLHMGFEQQKEDVSAMSI